jgi:hypothetical protein
MSEIRARVWLAAAACAAAAAALTFATGSDRDGGAAASTGADPPRASARVWPPPAASPPRLPLPAPAREPVTRETLRELWDAEDGAARLVDRSGFGAGLEIPLPPRLPGETPDAHRRRWRAIERQVMADALLAEVRMREYYESSELPQGGLLPQEYRKRFQRGPRLGTHERLEALERAQARIEALRAEAGGADAS